jgi:predicted amidohydrolase YtcJ
MPFTCAVFLAVLAAAEPADLIVLNANVLSMDGNHPVAKAFAVKAGKFARVGSSATIKRLAGPKTHVLDLGGKTVVPGFIDAHAHPRPIFDEDFPWYNVEAGPNKVKTMAELIAAIRRKAGKTPKGMLISGTGYQETKLGRHPTRHDLDKATTDHPVVIRHSSGHLSVCNSAALKLAKVTKETADPKGGKFERDEKGEPTGLLKERAAGIVRAAAPRQEVPEADQVAGYRTCLRLFLANGLTGVHVAGTDPRSASLLSAARRQDSPVRLYIMLRENHIDQAVELKKAMADDEWGVRYGAIKSFYGNSLSGQTAWLYEPYTHAPDYVGLAPGRSRASLAALVLRIHKAGLQSCIHSNGDREIDVVLDAYEAALKAAPRKNHRHRIEHCSVVNQAILRRIKALDLVIAPHSYVYEHGDKLVNFGPARWDWMLPNRSLIDQGTVVAGNSDYPISAALPLLRIHDMVNRTSAAGKVYGPKQRCTVDQALRAFTLGSAYAEFAEDHKGSITAGKLADFVVLDRDPRKVDPKAIKDVAVLRTVIGGKTVFEKRKIRSSKAMLPPRHDEGGLVVATLHRCPALHAMRCNAGRRGWCNHATMPCTLFRQEGGRPPLTAACGSKRSWNHSVRHSHGLPPAGAAHRWAKASIVSRATAGPTVMPLPRMPVTR